jgi:hypothetical protein
MGRMGRKRLYVFDTEDDGFDDPGRFAVVHTSLREAKKWLWNDPDVKEYCEQDYINFNPYWLRSVDVSDREIGDDMVCIEGIKRGVYTWIDGEICPICGQSGKISKSDDWDKVCCSECDDKMYEEWEAQKAIASSVEGGCET